MTLKERVVFFCSPIMRSLLAKTISDLKPLFLSESPSLRVELIKYGFHPSLCTHPSVLFGLRKRGITDSSLLGLKIAYLKKCIKLGLLKDDSDHIIMQDLGLQPCYGNGVDFWFVESHSPMIPYSIPDNPKPNGRIVVYSALTGNYDNVHELLYKEDDVDYLLFTNNPSLKSKTWRVITVQSDLDDLLLSRFIKMMPHKYLGKEYETSIYIDANAVIYGEISELTRYLGEEKAFAVSHHGERSSVREEADAIIKILDIDKMAVMNQYNRYLNDGFDDNSGLAECNILVRKHNDMTLINLMDLWWDEFRQGVKRDQLSLMPCIEKSSFNGLAWMEGGYSRHNQFCRIVSHKQS